MTMDNEENFITLKKAGRDFVDKHEDVRGRQVLDRDGKKLGKVEALLIDEKENKVRFLQVEVGGFLGIGKKKTLVPIEAISSITAFEVHIDRTGSTVASGPVYDPQFVERKFFEDAYGHYGLLPYWDFKYVRPKFPPVRKHD